MKECKEMNVVVIMNGMQKNKALKKRLAKIETNGKEREMKKKKSIANSFLTNQN